MIWRLLAICAWLSLRPISQDAKAPQTTPKDVGTLIYSVKGPDLFRNYCAPCHGSNAKGDGPTAPSLKAKVPDLTQLAIRNKGVFPAGRVKEMILGTASVRSHGSSEMPVWGPIFHQVEYDQDLGDVRVDNLVKYLQSIQQK